MRWGRYLISLRSGWFALPSPSLETSTMPKMRFRRHLYGSQENQNDYAVASCPWAYLLQMVRNEALQIARRKHRWTTAVSLIDLVTSRKVDELEMEETHRAVWAALRTLPPQQAEVVVLKIWEDMTFAQIGHVLETSPNTIASRYQYAMAKLSQTLLKQHREARHD